MIPLEEFPTTRSAQHHSRGVTSTSDLSYLVLMVSDTTAAGPKSIETNLYIADPHFLPRQYYLMP
jgi:hypothetical protein